jgi:hypothetical protein
LAFSSLLRDALAVAAAKIEIAGEPFRAVAEGVAKTMAVAQLDLTRVAPALGAFFF